MIFYIVKWTIFSLVLIMLVHHLYNFFRGTLTIPKTRDLVYRPVARYEEMLSTVKGSNKPDANEPNIHTSQEMMKDELAAFLKDLKKSNPKETVSPAQTEFSTRVASV